MSYYVRLSDGIILTDSYITSFLHFHQLIASIFKQGLRKNPQENGGDGEDESDLKQCVCNLIVAQKDGPKSTVMLSSNAQVVPGRVV